MNDQQVFAYLKKQKKDVLLDYLHAAFDIMDAEQRRTVFADVARPQATKAVDGRRLREEIEQFRRASLARKYYAPFNVNSKNYMDVPEETEEWCTRFAGLVAEACKLTKDRVPNKFPKRLWGNRKKETEALVAFGGEMPWPYPSPIPPTSRRP